MRQWALRFRGGPGSAVAVAALAALLAVPEVAAAPDVRTVSLAETSAREARVAIDPDGNAVMMFFYGDDRIADSPPAYCKLDLGETRDCTAAARSWSADGTLSAHRDLSLRFSGRLGEGGVVMNDDGRAVAVWAGSAQWGGIGGTVLRARASNGVWSDAEKLSNDPHDPQVGIDEEGTAVVAWLHPVSAGFVVKYHVQARVRSVGGALSAVQDVSPAGADGWNPRVAVAPDGRALFVWEEQLDPSDGDRTIQARARAGDGTLSAIQNVSPAGVDARWPQVRLDADGDAVILWQLGLGEGIQARARASTGGLSPVETLSPPGRGGSMADVDLLDDGRGVAVWSGSEPNFDTKVRLRVRSAAGVWSATETVSLPASLGEVFQPQVALDGSGRALVVWTQSSGGSLYEPLQMRARSPAGAWSTVRTLSEPRAVTWQSQLAVAPNGRAVAMWEDFWSFSDHRDWGPAIQAAAFSIDDLPPDLAPPETTLTSGPTGPTTKRRVTFRFRTNEPGSRFRCKLDAGAWRPCSSPKRYSNLAFGRHVFQVRATDPSGNVDPTPARRRFRVIRG
jgi:hypothetical protein